MLQIAGKPKENVEKALEKVLENIDQSKTFKVLESEIYEPELNEKSTLYSGLINIKIEFEKIEYLINFIYDYLPISVEIEKPNKIEFEIPDLNYLLNELSRRMLQSMNENINLKAYINHIKKKYNIKE